MAALRLDRRQAALAELAEMGAPAGQRRLQGRSEIRPFFEGGLRTAGTGLGRWYRTGAFSSDGRQLIWEYPRATPQGDQVDLVEVMDLAGGRIAHHRVSWGWVGFRALTGPAGR